VPTQPIRILQITDPHLHAHSDAMMRGLNTFESFKAIIERVNDDRRTPDAVIATGDLVQDETRQGYERFRKLVGELNVPVYCIPGNHDSPQLMNEILSESPFQYCGTGQHQDWSIIMLNSAVRWNDYGKLEADQLEILQHTLETMPSKYALICMHHHPIPMGSQWLDNIGLQNSDEFFALIDQFPTVRCITWGHVHQASHRNRNGVAMISSPSTGSQFLPESDGFRLDSRPPGYRWISLMPDGSIETEVIWL
jgi:Icc protein